MKSRSKELLEKSIVAMIAAIEIYNKPDFKYREETFAILALNSWELFLKAKWLKEHKNKISCLYVYEKKRRIKKTRSGNPLTHAIDFIAPKLCERKLLDHIVWSNIEILMEIRDSAIHFYNKSSIFALRLQEIGSATLKNYIGLVKEWFNHDLSKYNFYLMPLAFINVPKRIEGVVLSDEELSLIKFIESLEKDEDISKPYSISISVDVSFSRSKVKDALKVQISNDPDAPKLHLTEEQFKDRFPLSYDQLVSKLRKRYSNFKVDKIFHSRRRTYMNNLKYCMTRKLDPGNPKSAKKDFYNESIINEFDKQYLVIK